ncbi:MAG: hypothetical protein IJL71_02365 [Oscillospiraceae bacterium]|nr:hypothetical protein [Oscillospiraceae bacterium]
MNDTMKSVKETITGEELDRLKEIASTDAGKALGQMVNSEELQKAAAKGDMDTLKNAVAQLLKTDAGAKLADRIAEMMNRK